MIISPQWSQNCIIHFLGLNTRNSDSWEKQQQALTLTSPEVVWNVDGEGTETLLVPAGGEGALLLDQAPLTRVAGGDASLVAPLVHRHVALL